MTKEEMDKLLRTSPTMLTNIEKQRRFVLAQSLLPRPCIHPDCDARVNQVDACEQGIEGYDVDRASIVNTFRCPKCKTPLAITVPFITAGPSWQWGKVRKKDQ